MIALLRIARLTTAILIFSCVIGQSSNAQDTESALPASHGAGAFEGHAFGGLCGASAAEPAVDVRTADLIARIRKAIGFSSASSVTYTLRPEAGSQEVTRVYEAANRPVHYELTGREGYREHERPLFLFEGWFSDKPKAIWIGPQAQGHGDIRFTTAWRGRRPRTVVVSQIVVAADTLLPLRITRIIRTCGTPRGGERFFRSYKTYKLQDGLMLPTEISLGRLREGHTYLLEGAKVVGRNE